MDINNNNVIGLIKPEIKFEKGQQKFKLLIPTAVEKKIRFLCKEINKLEWSGVLFYTTEGSFEDENLIIKCVDLYQMDIGSTTFTEFKESSDIVGYMVDHPELVKPNIYRGLVHSHHSMDTFFSGTDVTTLKEEGSDMAHFISLIVNNAGNYNARVTKKSKVAQQISEKYSYTTWGGNLKEGIRTITKEEDTIEWFDLDIIFEDSEFEKEMLKRIENIRELKAKASSKIINPNYYKESAYGVTDFYPNSDYQTDYYNAKHQFKQTELPFEAPDDIDFSENVNISYDKIVVDKAVINSAVKQIITSSVIISNDNEVNITKWVSSMDKLYTKRFKDLNTFEYFASNYIDFIVNNVWDDNILKQVKYHEDEAASVIAYHIRKALMLLPSNRWLNMYIKTLDDFII